jgi:hypothetical protein
MPDDVILRICNSVRSACRLTAACCNICVLRTALYNGFGSWSAETKRSSWPRTQVTSSPRLAALRFTPLRHDDVSTSGPTGIRFYGQ